MKWSRELRIARRSLRTAMKAASSMASATARLPAPMRSVPWPPSPQLSSRELAEVTGFGNNPGRLAMFLHVPPVAPKPGAPLIVLLHGCGQTAAGSPPTRAGSHWPTGWAFLSCCPSSPARKPKADVFNWFRPLHVRRRSWARRCRSDRWSTPPSSALVPIHGGCSLPDSQQVAQLAAALLAAYPADDFAGGAIVAGLPVGAAVSATESLGANGQCRAWAHG